MGYQIPYHIFAVTRRANSIFALSLHLQYIPCRTHLAEITDNLTTICQHFKDDLDYRKLRQSFEDLLITMDNEPAACVQDIVDRVVELGPAQRLHAQLVRLLTLYRVMPVTSATAERSFSTLRRVKTYLRSTMTQKRLNSVLVLHAHQDYTDSINMRHVA